MCRQIEKSSRRRVTIALVAVAVLVVGRGMSCAADPPLSIDWPQWRGLTRDGIAPAGPKLLDAWPEEGPRLIWKSGPLPSAAKGGSGSVAVAQGKAFVLVNAGKAAVVIDEARLQSALSEVVKEFEQKARRRSARRRGEISGQSSHL